MCTMSVLRAVRGELTKELDIDLKKLGFIAMTCDLDGPRLKL